MNEDLIRRVQDALKYDLREMDAVFTPLLNDVLAELTKTPTKTPKAKPVSLMIALAHTYASNEVNVARVGDTTLFADHNDTVCEADDRNAKPTTDPAYVLNGWRMHRGPRRGTSKGPYKGDLAPESYIGPNGEVVHVLNSSEYASVCVNDWVVFGPDPAHVRAFLQACGFKGVRIAKTAIVQQTL